MTHATQGQELSDDEPLGGAPRRPGLSLKARALRYLAMREHSRAELERKLARHVDVNEDGAGAAHIARVLDELASDGLLDDQRAAEALVASQARRFGVLTLRQRLRDRGVAPEAAAAALAGLDASEHDRARAVWQRKFGQAAATPTDRARQARFLAGRGFSADIIRRLVNGIEDD